MSAYNSAKNRQSETRSSAWAFLLVGCIGFVIILLALLGVIRLPFGTFPLLIMEVMFVIFLVIAGLSFKHAMNMLDEISKENDLETRIRDWAKENLTVVSQKEIGKDIFSLWLQTDQMAQYPPRKR